MVSWQPSPILIKEMRSTMRGKRTFVGLTLFLLFLAGISLIVYAAITSESLGRPDQRMGQMIFGVLSFVEMLMLAMVTPPLTSGAIATERQKQTFEMLVATPLTPLQILRGKFLASMNYLFLLMFATLPINSIVFLFGGVSPASLLWWFLFVVTLLSMLGALGLLMSTLFKSSGVATAVCYLVCVLLFGALPFMVVLTGYVVAQDQVDCLAVALLLTHPFGSLAAIVVTDDGPVSMWRLLPATVPLYGALAGLLFLTAEARLAALTGQHWRRPFVVMGLLGIVTVAGLYILLGPVVSEC